MKSIITIFLVFTILACVIVYPNVPYFNVISELEYLEGVFGTFPQVFEGFKGKDSTFFDVVRLLIYPARLGVWFVFTMVNLLDHYIFHFIGVSPFGISSGDADFSVNNPDMFKPIGPLFIK